MSRNDRSEERRKRPWLLLIIAALAGCAFIIYRFAAPSKPVVAARPMPPAVSVQTTVVEPKQVEITRSGLGTVTAWQMANITPQVSGRIVAIPFREGKQVEKGAPLVEIDPRPFQAALDQAKAKKAQDEANLANTQKNLNRDQTLITKGGFATQQTVDNEKAQVQGLQAAIEGDQASIEAAQLNLEFATVTAPFPGVVSIRNVDIGNLVSPTTIIGTVTQIEPIAVYFTLPESDLSEVQEAAANGNPAVLVYDQTGKKLLSRGLLEVINNQVDQTTGTIRLKARFDNKDHKLWPGAFVQVQVVVATEPNALAVPSAGVQHGPDGEYVWLVSSNQTVHRQAIKVGAVQNDQTVISNGLKAGDRIVIAGQYGLTQGARVAEANPGQVQAAQGKS